MEDSLAFWRGYFHTRQRKSKHDMTNLIPAAGRGKRFADAGYALPKPLIPVDGEPMLVRSVKALPQPAKWVFVCLENHMKAGLGESIRKEFPTAVIIPVKDVTQGMLNTCMLAEKYLDLEKPLLISACDYGLQYDMDAFDKLVKDKTIDVVIWTFRRHECVDRNPNAYAYVAIDKNGVATAVSEKKTISNNPGKDHAVVSVFYFRTAGIFLEGARKLIESGKTINNEYYVATSINELIETGKKVVPFEVDKFVCWGTPEDLKEYEHWKGVFGSI